jgi:hypothetical protein
MDDLDDIVSNASSKHILGASWQPYKEGFVTAFRSVYGALEWRSCLQHKFFLPDESNYSDERYFQSAAELTVSNHVLLQSVVGFTPDKNVNPTNKRNVDTYFRLGPTIVAIEVKCPVEPKPEVPPTTKPVILLKTAGRIPNHDNELTGLKEKIEASGAAVALMGKNKDATHKEYLIAANRKFDPASSVDNLNILFIAGGSWGDMGDWYMHLYGGQGLFTAESFHPSSDFRLVDVVILSNLRYWHQHVRDRQDWTLKNVFVLPRINPYGRSSRTSDATYGGLSVFDHHLQRFTAFVDVAEDSNDTDRTLEPRKLHHYVNRSLSTEEKARYFPVDLYPLSH